MPIMATALALLCLTFNANQPLEIRKPEPVKSNVVVFQDHRNIVVCEDGKLRVDHLLLTEDQVLKTYPFEIKPNEKITKKDLESKAVTKIIAMKRNGVLNFALELVSKDSKSTLILAAAFLPRENDRAEVPFELIVKSDVREYLEQFSCPRSDSVFFLSIQRGEIGQIEGGHMAESDCEWPVMTDVFVMEFTTKPGREFQKLIDELK